MTTQREPDTSAEGLRELAVRATKYIIGPENLLEQIVATLRALADAAGQAAPVPPPVEGLETTHNQRKEWLNDATNETSPDFIFGDSPEDVARLLRDFTKVHERADALAVELINRTEERERYFSMHAAAEDRAEGLAKEVERLREDCAFLHRRRGQLCIQRDEEVAKHKATHAAYREAEADAEQWRERAKAVEARLAVYEAPIGDVEVAEAIGIVAAYGGDPNRPSKVIDLLRRLSAAHAECKGENTKLREAVSRARRELEHGWPVSAASTLDAALAPASGEKAT